MGSYVDKVKYHFYFLVFYLLAILPYFGSLLNLK